MSRIEQTAVFVVVGLLRGVCGCRDVWMDLWAHHALDSRIRAVLRFSRSR